MIQEPMYVISSNVLERRIDHEFVFPTAPGMARLESPAGLVPIKTHATVDPSPRLIRHSNELVQYCVIVGSMKLHSELFLCADVYCMELPTRRNTLQNRASQPWRSSRD